MAEYMQAIVFMIEDFRIEAYYWNCLLKFQEFMFAFVLVVEPNSAQVQGILFIVMLVVSLGLTTRFWPLKCPIINVLLNSAYGVLALLLASMVALTPSPQDGSNTLFVSLLLKVSVLFPPQW
jgi:hypothetical protein